VLEEEACALNPGFIKRMTQHRPFVRSKLAMSLDGRTAMASGESKWITSSQARADVHKLRAQSSAVLTGINTVLADDPALNARVDRVTDRLRQFRPPWMEEVPTTAGSSRGHHPWQSDVLQPVRVVLDTKLQMPVSAQMGKLPGRSLILTGSADEHKKNQLHQAGFEVHRIAQRRSRLDLHAVMAFLADQHINELLVEAGPILNGALMAENLVDEWIIYMAPCILGDQGRGLFTIPGMHSMADKKTLTMSDVRQIGPDLKLTLIPH
jgi:diaminohydroxyphosphoribosylaminopyrimidine deaminase/5-amino-6-(5-phosphoribosylamino)uracil reductase